MVSGAQKGYYPPPPQSSGGQQQHSAYQNASQGQNAPPGAPFTGFKLGGSVPPPQQQRRVPAGNGAPKRWTMEQLRASDAIIPLQSGTNQFASQRGMTGFGSPRNTTTPVYGGLDMPPETEAGRLCDAVVPLQYGTNQFASQRGMTGFGAPRDVTGKHLHRLYDDDYLVDQQGANGNANADYHQY